MHVEEGPFKQFLIEAGLLTRSALDAVVRDAEGRPLARFLIERGILSEDETRRAVAHTLGVPFVSLDRDDVSLEALQLIPEPLAREHNAVAYKLGGHQLEVALLDIADLEHLGFLDSRYRVLPRLTSRESLTRTLIRYQQHLRDTYGRSLEKSESPNLLDTLLRHALACRASDIHLQNDDKGLLVRYRIHGSLKEAMTLPPATGKNLVAKLRAVSQLPGGMLPREGRLRVDLGSGEDVAVRVSSVPIIAGEKLVLNIVREQARRGFTLETLGFHGVALEAMHKALLRRRGLVLVGGQTGGGKTTTLYTLLDMLNVPEVSIVTLEKTVEHVLPRAAQIEIGAGLTPGATLRAALRQDPDVVMLGEIADKESAALALEAARRGVFVLAGVESAGARGAVEAYQDFGVSDERLAQALTAAVGVATVRKLGSKQFPQTHKLTRGDADALEGGANFANVLQALKEEGKVAKDTPWKDVQFYKAVASTDTPDGYQGILGVQEVVVDAELCGLNLVEDALFKAAQGLTTIEEVGKLL